MKYVYAPQLGYLIHIPIPAGARGAPDIPTMRLEVQSVHRLLLFPPFH